MRKQIFTAIAEKLLTVHGITYVDLWNDNGAHFAGGAVYPLPSVFVEFETIEWHQQGNAARRADSKFGPQCQVSGVKTSPASCTLSRPPITRITK